MAAVAKGNQLPRSQGGNILSGWSTEKGQARTFFSFVVYSRVVHLYEDVHGGKKRFKNHQRT